MSDVSERRGDNGEKRARAGTGGQPRGNGPSDGAAATWFGGLRMDPTGVPRLDAVLGGGLPSGSLVIVVGPPGSGKTTLANQMAFAAAKAQRRALVVSAISEPTSKLIAHLRSFRFYEDDLVGDAVQFLSLEQFLTQGLPSARDELIAMARQARADLVVLDGFRGVRGADADPQAARQFLYDVGTTLSVLGATTIITSEADPRDPAFFPESTTADVIIGLHYRVSGVLQWRALEPVKVRGAAVLPGLHAFALDRGGATVHPRLESLVSGAYDSDRLPYQEVTAEDLSSEDVPAEKVSFGIPSLDDLLGGGVTAGTSTLLIGSLGTGKTLLGLHYALAGVAKGEPALMVGFRETPYQLLEKTRPFAIGTAMRAALAEDGGLTMQRWAPVELHPDIVTDRLLQALDRTGARRLVVDSVLELEHAVERGSDANRVSDFLAALLEVLRQRDVTSVFIKEHRSAVASDLDLLIGPSSVLAENVLLLQQVTSGPVLRRVLSVVKMRFSSHDSLLREFRIAVPEGIQFLGLYDTNTSNQVRGVAPGEARYMRDSDGLRSMSDTTGGTS